MMKRFSLLSVMGALCLLAANAFAQGAADKITGGYTRAGCNGCQPGDTLNFVASRLVNAHEASDKHPQKGFFYSWNDAGRWFAMDFTDTFNTCVNVYEDGKARIGGVIEYGNGPQVGRVFGIYLEDHDGPAYFSDKSHTVRFTLEYSLVETARQYLHYWCETGLLMGDELKRTGYAEWPGIVIGGNFVIHNSPADGD